MTNSQLTDEQRKDVKASVHDIRVYLKNKGVSEERFMDACFRASLAMIFLGLRPISGNICPKYKGRALRDTWRWDICYGFKGGTTHVFNSKAGITIWPGKFTLEQAMQFASDMEEGGFLKKLNSEARKPE